MEITAKQLRDIEEALWLAKYFVDEHYEGREQDVIDRDVYQAAMKAINQITGRSDE